MSGRYVIEAPRIFLYSHDTFGLGHLRRNRKIAASIIARVPNAAVTIATGSDVSESFPPLPGVSFVQLPAVVKMPDGSYQSTEKGTSFSEVLRRRSEILLHTTERIRPQIMIADKEPLGLRGELEAALQKARATNCRTVLGLRDVLDSHENLSREWGGQRILHRLIELYDEIWIYGGTEFHDPLSGFGIVPCKMPPVRFLGFLGSAENIMSAPSADPEFIPTSPYLLATAGGGGDGDQLISAVLSACECDQPVKSEVLLLLGPFMNSDVRRGFQKRAKKLANVTVHDFTADPEPLIAAAAGVVAMCGYNTFCEVMLYDKPALFVPREKPRKEQMIRAERAAELGVARMMRLRDMKDIRVLADELNLLPSRTKPSLSGNPIQFGGLPAVGNRIAELTREWQLAEPQAEMMTTIVT